MMPLPENAPLPEPSKSPLLGWRSLALGALIAFTTVARVWLIQHYPDPDGDAKGHLGIATALLSDPWSVAVHWVWPPGYHYFLAALLALGVTAQGVRFLDCALTALLPLLVWHYCVRTLDLSVGRTARLVPFLASVLCAALPVINLLGTSAQQGTVFTILVLLTATSLDTGRFALAGALLGAATMVRYEACGAVGLIAGLRAVGYVPSLVRRLPAPVARVCRYPLVVSVLPLAAMGAWLLAHRVADGTWFGFLRELYRFTHVQREGFHQDTWTDLLWFPVFQPYYIFGLSLPLFLLGIRRAWRDGWVVPLGIYLFLLGSYTFKGSLGSARYYESVAPFVCIAAAYGASRIGERWRPALVLGFSAAFAHVMWLLVLTGRWTFRPAAAEGAAKTAPAHPVAGRRGESRSRG